MSYYKLRVDVGDVSSDEIIAVVTKMCKKYAYVVEHVQGENSHMHWYCDLDVTAQHARLSLRKLGLKGNRMYSMGKLDEALPIQYIAYLFKQGKVTTHGIPEDVIEEAKEYDLKVKEEIKKKKTDKKSKIVTLTQLCSDIELDDPKQTKFRICTKILEYYVQHDLVINRFTVRSIVDTVYVRLFPYTLGSLATQILE